MICRRWKHREQVQHRLAHWGAERSAAGPGESAALSAGDNGAGPRLAAPQRRLQPDRDSRGSERQRPALLQAALLGHDPGECGGGQRRAHCEGVGR